MVDRPPQGAIAAFIGSLLSYIDTPWKFAVVAGLALLGFSGWIFWTHQHEIIESWLTPSEVSLKVGEVPMALEKLTTETDADLVQIWSVNLTANSQRFIGARRHDGDRPVIPEPRRLPIIVHASDIKTISDVIEGNPVCVEIEPQGTPFARRLAERGFRYGCAIPIPPGPSDFVGVIYLAWVSKPELSQEIVAKTAAREIAGKLMNR